MKRIFAIAILALLVVSFSSAQTFEYIVKPRPPLTGKFLKMNITAPEPAVIWAFQLNFDLSATQLKPGVNGNKAVARFLNAAGTTISLSRLIYDENGLNRVQYSINAGVLFSGTTDNAPTFTPQGILLLGLFNNLVKFGPTYDIVRYPGDEGVQSPFGIVFVIGISPFNN